MIIAYLRKELNMLRKLFFVVAFFTVGVSLFSQTEADFDATLTEDYTGIRITNYKGNATEVSIPAIIQGMPVKEIGNSAFYGKQNITSVIIPDGVTFIGYEAFFACVALRSVIIPEGLTEIGMCAFWRCHALASITLPATIQKIGIGAFFDCLNLTTVTIPDTVERIEFFGSKRASDGQFRTFGNCKKLLLPSQAALRRRGYTAPF
jgi:hypothetical protein